MIRGQLDDALVSAVAAAAKRKGIAIPGFTEKDGKLVEKPKRTSVSTKIRQRKSKAVKPTRRIKGSQAP